MSGRPIVLRTERFRLEIVSNGRARSAVFIFRGDSRIPFQVEDLNVADAGQRAKLLERLPHDELLRTDVQRLLLEAAPQVAAAQLRTKSESTDARQGAAVAFPEIEPWPDEVDGAALLDEIARFCRRYVVLSAEAADAATLWAIHAHAHDAAAVSPILHLCSPEKRCGKTTLLIALSCLVPRPMTASNVSDSVLFRSVERHRPTLLIDELDSFIDERAELRNLLNSGHTRGTAYVLRNVGEEHEPRLFSVWAPKILAGIGRVQDTIADRSISIRLLRRAPDERIERLRQDRIHQEAVGARRRAARWASDHFESLCEHDPEVPEELHDRAADNWRPLLGIADLAGGAWPSRARRAAAQLSGGYGAEPTEGESIRTLLLHDLRGFSTESGADRWSSEEIAGWLAKREDRPWGEWGRHQKPLSARALASLLSPFQIRPRPIRLPNGEMLRGYLRDDFADAFRRFLPLPDPSQRNIASATTSYAASRSVTGDVDVTDRESHNSLGDGDVTDVTDREAVGRRFPCPGGCGRLFSALISSPCAACRQRAELNRGTT